MKRIVLIVLAVLVVSTLVELPFRDSHGHFPWSGIVGFYALFGLIGCMAIILVAKWLGHYWLQRKENYYDGDDNNNG